MTNMFVSLLLELMLIFKKMRFVAKPRNLGALYKSHKGHGCLIVVKGVHF